MPEQADIRNNNLPETSKITGIFIVMAVGLVLLVGVGGVFFVKSFNSEKAADQPITRMNGTVTSNTLVESDRQVVTLSAKGGFEPIKTVAKANKATVLQVSTKNTFDCSSVINIPSIGLKKNLPASGTTEIEIPAQKPGTKLAGTCSLGLYNFSISFVE